MIRSSLCDFQFTRIDGIMEYVTVDLPISQPPRTAVNDCSVTVDLLAALEAVARDHKTAVKRRRGRLVGAPPDLSSATGAPVSACISTLEQPASTPRETQKRLDSRSLGWPNLCASRSPSLQRYGDQLPVFAWK